MDPLNADQVLEVVPEVEPGPVESAQPDSTPAEPAPVEPETAEPAPAEPAPITPETPGPVAFESVESAQPELLEAVVLAPIELAPPEPIPLKAVRTGPPVEPKSADSERPAAAPRKKRPAPPRGERVAAGLEELQTWLFDVARNGLEYAQQQPPHFFEAIAARMTQARASGIARRLREWPRILASGDEWASRALEEAGSLQWLLNGAARLDELPAALRASVRAAIGWPVNEKELLKDPAAETLSDHWLILGQKIEDDADARRVQRSWLHGEQTGRMALCVNYLAGHQLLDLNLVPGVTIEADLAFYPGTAPLHAVIKAQRNQNGSVRPAGEPDARENFDAALAYTRALLADDPWLERAPWLVRDCLPQVEHIAAAAGPGRKSSTETWTLRDRDGALIPLAPDFPNAWPLLAASGGAPVTVFGEWNGRTFLPLSVIAARRYIPLGGTLL